MGAHYQAWTDRWSGVWHTSPRVRQAAVALLLIAVFLLPLLMGSVGVDDATFAEVYVLLALGLNIVVGFAGLLDLGYAAFFAIGAYTTALLASSHFGVGTSFHNIFVSVGPNGIHINFFLLIPIAAMTAAFFGILFGAPTLRLRGDYLAIVTLGFGEIVPKVIENLGPGNSLGLPNITNGVNNITGVDAPPNFTLGPLHWSFQSNDPKPWYYLGLIIIIISVVIIYRMRDSRLGRPLRRRAGRHLRPPGPGDRERRGPHRTQAASCGDRTGAPQAHGEPRRLRPLPPRAGTIHG